MHLSRAWPVARMHALNLTLRSPDFTTARRIAQAVNAFLGEPAARPTDNGTIAVELPAAYDGSVVNLVTDIEQLRIEPDQPARVLVDESSGIIVMGENVRVSTVAIAQGNLTIRITEQPQVSQPRPFGDGATVVVPRTDVTVDEQSERKLGVVAGGVTLQELVNGLNALGVGPRDLISILQAVKAAGALQAALEMM